MGAHKATVTQRRSQQTPSELFVEKLSDARGFVESLGRGDAGFGTEGGAAVELRQASLRSHLRWLIGALLSKGGGVGAPAWQSAQCWALLAALLRCGADSATAVTLSPNLADPLTAAVQAGGAELGAAVAEAAEQLCSAGWNPGLERSSNLAACALTASQSCGWRAEWLHTATSCTRLLQTVATEGSNAKKSFTCIASQRVLLPVLSAAFQSSSNGNMDGARALAQACKDLLSSTLLRSSNVVGIAEACAGDCSIRGDGQQVEAKESSEGGKHSQQSFHSTLFRSLLTAVQDELHAQAVLNSTPWLLEQFCTALRGHREAEQEQLRGVSATSHDGVPKGRRVAVDPHHDFSFLRALGRLHMAAFQRPRPASKQSECSATAPGKRKRKRAEGAKAGVNDAAALHEVSARCAVSLMTIVKTHGIYRPAEDKTGQELQFLQAFVESALETLLGKHDVGDGPLETAHLSSIARFCAAVMEVEHRAVQPQIERIWELLWRMGVSRGDAEEPQSCEATAVAAEVASAIVRSYGELRQLQWMLESLSPTLSNASEQVIASHAFVSTLQSVIRNLHAGLAAPLIRWVAEDVRKQGLEAPQGSIAASRGAIYVACLQNVRVDLATAMPIAAAVKQLLQSSFSTSLMASVLAPSPPEGSAAMIAVYRAALGLHRACSNLHPSVPALTDQPHDGRGGKTAGYFAPARVAAGEIVSEPTLKDVSEAWGGRNLSAKLRHPFRQAIMQRFQTIHDELLHMKYSCSTATTNQRVEGVDADVAQEEGELLSQELACLAPHLIQELCEREPHKDMSSASSLKPQLLASPRLCGMWLQHAEPPDIELAIRSIVSHFSGTEDPARLLWWFENSGTKRVRSALLPAVLAQVVSDTRAVLKPLLLCDKAEQSSQEGEPPRRRRTIKDKPAHAHAWLLGAGLESALDLSLESLDVAPDSTATQAAMGAILQARGFLCATNAEMVAEAPELGSLKFSLSLLQLMPAAYFQNGVALRGVKLLLHIEACLLTGLAFSVAPVAAADPGETRPPLALRLAELFHQCRASLGACMSRIKLDADLLPCGVHELLSWIWQSAEEAAAFALTTGSEAMLGITEQMLSATQRAGAMALRLQILTDAPSRLAGPEDNEVLQRMLCQCLGDDTSGAHRQFGYISGALDEEGESADEWIQRCVQNWILVSRLQAGLLACKPCAVPNAFTNKAIFCGPEQTGGHESKDDGISALGGDEFLLPLSCELSAMIAEMFQTAVSSAMRVMKSPSMPSETCLQRHQNFNVGKYCCLCVAAGATNAAASALQANLHGGALEMVVTQLECILGLLVAARAVKEAACRSAVVGMACNYMTAVSHMLFIHDADGSQHGVDIFPKMVACHMFCLRWVIRSELRCRVDPLREGPTTALLATFRTIVLHASCSARNQAYSALAENLGNSSSVADMLPSLLLLETCFRAERTIVGWSALPAGWVFQKIAKAILRVVDTLTSPSLEVSHTWMVDVESTAGSPEILALSSAVYCLECIASKSRLFHMSPQQVARALRIPMQVSKLLSTGAAEDGIRWHGRATDGQAIDKVRLVFRCCRMMGALIRHHHAESRRSMSIVSSALRKVTILLMEWSSGVRGTVPRREDLLNTCLNDAQHGDTLREVIASCAKAVSDVMSEVASHPPAIISKYCVHLVGDYLTATTASSKRHATQSKVTHDSSSFEEVKSLLRRGAVALYGACARQEIQHLHAILSTEPDAALHRQLLQELKQDYEQDLKFTGKI